MWSLTKTLSIKLFVVALISVGTMGCSKLPVYKIGGYEVTVHDQFYYFNKSRAFCSFVNAEQFDILLVDYENGFCNDGPQDDMGQTLTASKDRNVIHLLLGREDHNPRERAYSVLPVDCQIGPGNDATAYMLHYPAGSVNPQRIEIASGSAVLKYDEARANDAQGTFDLTFADGSKATGDFKAAACN